MEHGFRSIIGFLSLLSSVLISPAYAQISSAEHKDYSYYKKHPTRHYLSPIDQNLYFPIDEKKVKLGQAFFFDKELSGNRNISCATCHNPLAGTSDGLSINLGEGAIGFGKNRSPGSYPPLPSDPLERGQRNAPALFDLGNSDYRFLMHDGRFETPIGGSYFSTPAKEELPDGFENLLEVISIFAFTEAQEMLGQPGENNMADTADFMESPFVAVWEEVVARIKAIPAYESLILDAYPELNGSLNEFGIVHVGRAIAHFQSRHYRTSPDNAFDRFLRGDIHAISRDAAKGFRIFTGKGKCVRCHNGPFLTDQKFHAIAMPQIGPGFGGVGFEGREDFGRELETGLEADRYKFRTPPLRNVALTGPWGHNGAFSTLEGVIRHHLNPTQSLFEYSIEDAILPSRFDLDELDSICLNEPHVREEIAARNAMPKVSLTEKDVGYLIEFLYALTDPRLIDLRHTIPMSVPSQQHMFD